MLRSALALIAVATLASAQNGTEELLLSPANDTNSTGGLDACAGGWIGTIVAAGLFIVSETLPFISKTPSNGIIHTVINLVKKQRK